MSKKVFILSIPGIGTQKQGFSENLVDALTKETKHMEVKGNCVFYECIPFNTTKIDKHQDDLFKRLDAKNRLGGVLSLRKFVMEAFGDGVTFERNADAENSPYQKVHKNLFDTLSRINEEIEQCESAKLVIVASSLGAHILSSYIWDADNSKRLFKTLNAGGNSLRNLNYLATIGCNIPLFVSGYPEEKIIAFDKRNEAFVWDNYYDKDDVLGWPLKQLSASYNTLVNDIEINTGMYVGSHIRYWDDKDFIKPLAKKINELYKLM